MSQGLMDVCGAGCLGDDPNSVVYRIHIVFVLESNR